MPETSTLRLTQEYITFEWRGVQLVQNADGETVGMMTDDGELQMFGAAIPDANSQNSSSVSGRGDSKQARPFITTLGLQ